MRKRERTGLSHSKEYKAWENMRTRCECPSHQAYRYYGARGIKVCEEWRNSFAAFYRYVGPAPSPKHTLERKESSKDYEPGNVCWATWKEQGLNKPNSRWVTAFGAKLRFCDWSMLFGAHPTTIKQRLESGWTPEDAVSRPPLMCGRRVHNERMKHESGNETLDDAGSACEETGEVPPL